MEQVLETTEEAVVEEQDIGIDGDTSSPDYGAGGVGAYIADPFIGPTAPSYGTPGPEGSTRYFAGGGSGSPGPGSTVNAPLAVAVEQKELLAQLIQVVAVS